MIKINSNNIDKNIKTYYNKLNMYPERVLEVPHSGTSFFTEIFKMTKTLRKKRKKKKTDIPLNINDLPNRQNPPLSQKGKIPAERKRNTE